MDATSYWPDGAIDLHCHFGPEEVIPATPSVDAIDVAHQAAEQRFRAVVLKSHDFPSVVGAAIVNRLVPEVEIFGSVCCDFGIGGLNPLAVEMALRAGAKVVWLPTISSQQDVINGLNAEFGLPDSGIILLDEGGGLRDEVMDILRLAEEFNVPVASGHTTLAEHFAVARKIAHRTPFIVTHAMQDGSGPHLTIDACVELARLGAYIEFTANSCMGSHQWPPLAKVVEAIGAIGTDRVVLSSDFGWNDQLPTPAFGLMSFVGALREADFSEAALGRMVCTTPAALLNL